MVQEDEISPILAIFVLRDSRVHVGFTNGCNITTHIKASVNEYFSIAFALNIPYINLNYSHI